MKYFILAFAFIALTISVKTQWVSNYAGNNELINSLSDARGNAVISDNAGNSYVTGYIVNPETGKDIILIKYNPSGETDWVRTFNGSDNSDDEGNDIVIDPSGNLYITGYISVTGTSGDIAVLKYDNDGVLQWASTYYVYNGNAEDRGLDITLDNSGNSYITGYGYDANGIQVIVTQQYSTSGACVWTNTESGSGGDARGHRVAIDHNGNILITGYITASYSYDMVLLKYDNLGSKIFQRQAGGVYEDKAWGIAVDELDNILISGYTTNPDNNTDAYLVKFDSSGSMIWERSFDGGNSEDKAWGIAVDEDNCVYITGNTTGAFSNVNYITLKYDPSGNQLWASEYDGSGSGIDKANAIGLICNNGEAYEVIVAGESWGSDGNFDFATVHYKANNGSELEANRYSMSASSDDRALSLWVNISDNTIYLTGYSQLIFESPNTSSYISSIMYQTHSSVISDRVNIPSEFRLSQNFPNPFNPATKISFNIPYGSIVKLTVYDMLGKVVGVLVDKYLQQGSYSVNFSNSSLASGVYFYELNAGGSRDIKKMTLVK
jgi:hypothetical protein